MVFLHCMEFVPVYSVWANHLQELTPHIMKEEQPGQTEHQTNRISHTVQSIWGTKYTLIKPRNLFYLG